MSRYKKMVKFGKNAKGREKTPYPCPALLTLNQWDDVVSDIKLMTGHITGIGLIAQIIGTSEHIIKRILDEEEIISLREKDELYEVNKRKYNNDISHHLITHSIDGYKTSKGSIVRMHHNRANNYYSDEKTILMINLVNHITGKQFSTFYTIEKNEDETSLKIMNCIQQALDAGETIQYLQLDKVLSDVINGLELLGITPVIYEKTIKHPYSSRIEATFGNPSKQYYLNNGSGYGHYTPRKKEYKELLRRNNKFIDLNSDEALMLFSAYVEMYQEKKINKLHIFEDYISEKIKNELKISNS